MQGQAPVLTINHTSTFVSYSVFTPPPLCHRNKDFQEVTLEKDGVVVLCFASTYGFRNIQNLVQKLKRGKSPYHFVEVMACPSGKVKYVDVLFCVPLYFNSIGATLVCHMIDWEIYSCSWVHICIVGQPRSISLPQDSLGYACSHHQRESGVNE